jgi:hypothetical protein
MAIPLYDVSVGCYLQTLTGVAGYLDKGLAHFTANNVDPNEVIETRLIPDMWPFGVQVQAAAHHSLGAINGVKKGVFGPPNVQPLDYRGLQKLIADTREGLKALSPAEVNALEGKDVIFQLGERKLPFVAEGFLLSFSLPNFHFHASTGYDILRMKGVPIGKRDYMGPLRMKG